MPGADAEHRGPGGGDKLARRSEPGSAERAAADDRARIGPVPEDPGWMVESADVAVLPLFRAATLLAILFDVLVAFPRLSGCLTATVFDLRIFIISSAASSLLFSYSAIFRRHWRPLAFCSISSWGIAATVIAAIDHNLELLCCEFVLLLTGSGALLPWQMVWQGAYTAASLACYAAVAALVGVHDDHAGMRWVVLFTASGIGEFCVALGGHHRRQIARGVRNLQDEAARREAAISELERTYRQLEQSETKLRRVFEASPDTICITSVADGRYIDISKKWLLSDQGGYKREEAIGNTSHALRIWVNEAQRQAFIAQLRASGNVQDFEADFRLKHGGVRTCVVSGSVVDLDGEPCLITVTSDITSQKETQRELIGAREAALAASRAKSEFLSNMSHELRTPMNSVLGMTDLLAETPLTDDQRRYVDAMTRNGNALLDLINSILDLVSLESGRLRLEEAGFDLNDLANDLSESLGARSREKQIELAVRISPEVPRMLLGDRLKLRQVLVNLIGNAIKFANQGEIMLMVANHALDEAHRWLRFSVTDNGIGIPAEKIESIFESFTQADSSSTRKHGGTGLGLAIARRLVELMGGTIWVESEPGRGSTFHFTARFGAGDARREARRPVDHQGSAGVPGAGIGERPLKILLAEDSDDNRQLIEHYMKDLPYTLDLAEDGRVAVEKFMGGRYDLVLMDMRMPRTDGYAAVREIRNWEREHDRASTPIVALTASALEADVRNCLDAGCTTHVSKPVKKSSLFAVIRQMTEKVPLEIADSAPRSEASSRAHQP